MSGIAGLPGTDGAFTLFGSGFMDAATTITVGGLTRVDQYTNQGDPTVSGARNDTLSGIVMPTGVEDTVRVTTAGGYAQLTIPAQAAPPFVEFDGLNATAPVGTAANTSMAAAVVGQTITLVGRGFNNSTLVQFAAEDQTGTVGVLTRTGSASADGTSLTVVVPAEAVTGTLHVVGASGSFPLQIVPTLRSVGGTVTAGGQIVIEGTGLAAGQLTVTIGGQKVTLASGAVHDLFADGMSQQAVDVTVPQGIAGGLIAVTTSGGSFTLQAGVTLTTLTPLTPATDPGDSLATALALGLSENSRLTVNQKIGDGADGANDVDLYSFTGAAGDLVTLDMGPTNTNPYPVTRLFDATGHQLAIGFYNQEPAITTFVLPSSGTFYIGISTSNNTGYDPTKANSGTGGNYTGSYAMTATLVAGGSSSLTRIQAPAALAAQPDLTPSTDPGDSLATAAPLTLPKNSVLKVHQQIGDGPNGANDVDLYSFTGTAGDLVTVDMGAPNTNPYPDTRLFDASGHQLAIGYYNTEPEIATFVLPSSGTFYVGVSSYNNTGYDPTKANSGSGGSYNGSYTLTLTRQVLTGVEILDATRLPKECHLVIGKGAIAGRVTSVVYSNTLGKAIGLAMLAPEVAGGGGDIEIRGEQGEMLTARIVPTPFYDPKNARQRVVTA